MKIKAHIRRIEDETLYPWWRVEIRRWVKDPVSFQMVYDVLVERDFVTFDQAREYFIRYERSRRVLGDSYLFNLPSWWAQRFA